MSKQSHLSKQHPEIGARAKARREELGLSVLDMAVLLQLGTNRVTQLEREGAEGITLLTKWAEALQMNPKHLVFGPPPTVKEPRKKRA